MPPIMRKSCLRDEILMRRRGVRGFKCERTARTAMAKASRGAGGTASKPTRPLTRSVL